MRERRAIVAALATVALLAGVVGAGACSTSGRATPPGASNRATPPFTLVALGDEATSLLQTESTIRDSWAQRFFLAAVPRSTTFVNLAQQRASVAVARAVQVPVVRELRPRAVVVLLGLGDVRVGGAVAAFAGEYAGLLADLQAAGARRVLVATLPVAAGAVGPYNDAIRGAARRAGAVVVDLAARSVSGSIDTRFGTFVPDAGGQQRIADAFAAAYRAAYPDA